MARTVTHLLKGLGFSTPIEVCERRDVKGLYARALAGEIKGFIGIDEPYKAPTNSEVAINTGELGVRECADRIIAKLIELGHILPHGHIAA
jgi:adenylylsulfate kinase-like enzyme